MHVAAYIEQHPGSPQTIKQHLAAIKMLFDYLVISQVVPVNPAAPVKGPTYVVKRGKTPIWVYGREDFLSDGPIRMIQSDHPAGNRMRRRRGWSQPAHKLPDATPPGKGPRCANFYVAFGTFVGI